MRAHELAQRHPDIDWPEGFSPETVDPFARTEIVINAPGPALRPGELPGTPHMQTLEQPALAAAALGRFLPAGQPPNAGP